MKQALSNKVAIVTGASRGIGRGIALKLAEEGAAVMLAARDAELPKEARVEIENKGAEPPGSHWICGSQRRRRCRRRRRLKFWGGLMWW